MNKLDKIIIAMFKWRFRKWPLKKYYTEVLGPLTNKYMREKLKEIHKNA